MALIQEKKVYPGTYPVVYGHADTLPGGCRLLNEVPKGYIIPRGAFIAMIPGTLTANLCKVGRVIAGGTAQAMRIEKGHPFKAGDIVILSGKKQGEAIKSIDSTNSDYDVFAFETGITGGDKSGVIVEANAAGSTSTPKFIPNGFVDRDKEYKDGDTSVAVACRGILIYSNAKTPAEYVEGIYMKQNPNILIVAQ